MTGENTSDRPGDEYEDDESESDAPVDQNENNMTNNDPKVAVIEDHGEEVDNLNGGDAPMNDPGNDDDSVVGEPQVEEDDNLTGMNADVEGNGNVHLNDLVMDEDIDNVEQDIDTFIRTGK